VDLNTKIANVSEENITFFGRMDFTL